MARKATLTPEQRKVNHNESVRKYRQSKQKRISLAFTEEFYNKLKAKASEKEKTPYKFIMDLLREIV